VSDQQNLKHAIGLIEAKYPNAVSFNLERSNNHSYGFCPGVVTLTDGSEVDMPTDVESEVMDWVGNIRWGGVVGENKYGDATIPINRTPPPNPTPQALLAEVDAIMHDL
jgi:hypothetical protein